MMVPEVPNRFPQIAFSATAQDVAGHDRLLGAGSREQQPASPDSVLGAPNLDSNAYQLGAETNGRQIMSRRIGRRWDAISERVCGHAKHSQVCANIIRSMT